MSGRTFEVDNKDFHTTRLQLEDGTYVEVNPLDLLTNAIENNCVADTSDLQATIDYLQELLNKMS